MALDVLKSPTKILFLKKRNASLEKAMSIMAVVAVAPRFSSGHYRRANAWGGRITTHND
jgi:hypothetical protein